MALTKTKINLGTEGNLSGSRSLLGIENTLVSSSAQLATSISGSFTAASSSFSTRVARNETSASSLTSDSGSFSTRITQATASISAATSSISALKTDSGSFSSRTSTLEGSGTAQGTGTTNSPTFADGTYTSNLGVSGSLTVKGMVTAQEFHTEFVSASIVYKSGSTKFGDDIDDIHSFTGSINQSGSFNLNDGNMSVTDTLTATTLTGTTIKDFSTISGSATSTGSFGAVHTAGKVGIGTTAPASTLEVAGKLTVDDSNSYIDLQRGGTTKATIGADSNGDFLVYSNSGYRFVVSGSSGNVGIGTTSPDYMFEVESTTADGTAKIHGATNAYLHLDKGAASRRAEIIFDTAGTPLWYLGTTDSDSSGVDGTEFAIGQTSGGANADLIIDSAGNVGIGTSSPSSYPIAPNLVVDASTNGGITIKSGTSNYGGIYFADGTTGNEQYRGSIQYNHNYAGHTDALMFGTAGSERMRIDSSGNVGIGNTAPGTGYSSGGRNLVIGDHTGHSGMTICSSTSGDGAICFADGTSGGAQTVAGRIIYAHNANRMDVYTADALRLQIDSVGATFAGDVSFGADTVDMCSSNKNFVVHKRFKSSAGLGCTVIEGCGRVDVNGKILRVTSNQSGNWASNLVEITLVDGTTGYGNHGTGQIYMAKYSQQSGQAPYAGSAQTVSQSNIHGDNLISAVDDQSSYVQFQTDSGYADSSYFYRVVSGGLITVTQAG